MCKKGIRQCKCDETRNIADTVDYVKVKWFKHVRAHTRTLPVYQPTYLFTGLTVSICQSRTQHTTTHAIHE